MTDYSKTSLLELFVFETNQLLEQLESIVLDSEKSGGLESAINEVFRIMHTIKGSAGMMLFDNIAILAHSVEDVFHLLREAAPPGVNYSELTDLVLNVIDFMKGEVRKLENGSDLTGDCSSLNEAIQGYLHSLMAVNSVSEENNGDVTYQAMVYFDEDCGMEDIRAFSLIHELKQIAQILEFWPGEENKQAAEVIQGQGFKILFITAASLKSVQECFDKTMFLRDFKITKAEEATSTKPIIVLDEAPLEPEITINEIAAKQSSGKSNRTEQNSESEHVSSKRNFISVNVVKMDLLMDLVGELVIAEVMVTQNPDLQGLSLDRFNKAAQQLRKITNELKETIMSVRMVPLSESFNKMHRIVRDMTKKLNKGAELEIIGEETEVDKNIIENISDPLMHLVRNAIDHGIESAEVREAKGKAAAGKIRLEAKNAGSDVWIIIQDDGGGLDKDRILSKAREKGLLSSKELELSDKEIYSLILRPGFSTKEAVTEFSGRGVGMDVVSQGIEKIGGSISIDSMEGQGTTFTIKIPLTLAIIEGMIVGVGASSYTIPITAIKESFRVQEQNIIRDTANNEMIMIRGECYPIIRLHDKFKIKNAITQFDHGIMIMIEAENRSFCLFADVLIGQQQVVVKALPSYIKNTQGISGCTLLGDGSVSLIVDIAGMTTR